MLQQELNRVAFRAIVLSIAVTLQSALFSILHFLFLAVL